MDSAIDTTDPLRPRPPDGLGRGAALAIVVHVGLVLALAFAVHWRQQPAATFSAELWSALPEQAAPRAVPTPAPPPPPPAPAPAPRPAPTPAPTPPPPVRADADIALEQARKRAAEAERQREQREQARERERQQELERRAERERQRDRERELEAKRQREAEAAALKQQRELQDKRREEQAKKAEEARRQAALDKQREENLKRMLGQAGVSGATGGATSTGSAARDSGPSASYAGKLAARIKPNIVVTDSLPSTLEAVVEVRATPTGTVLARRIVKSSGSAVWDDAVLRAIDRTGTLPRDTDGRVPTSIEISFRPE